MTAADPIDLSIGDPGYAPPEAAVAAAARGVVRGLGGYAPRGGLTGLRRDLADRLNARNAIAATPEQVVVTSGASLAIFATLATLCRPGDRVLLPDPGFPLYRLAATTLRLRVLRYPLQGPAAGYQPDWTALRELAAQARILLWNYPSNPLGAVCRPEWLPPLFAIVERVPDLVLLCDEVYEDLCLDGDHAGAAGAAGELADRTVSVFSFSKTFGMAAWRVGYLHAQPAWAARIAQAHWGMAMSTSTAAQLAARAALRAPAGYLAEQRAFLRANRDHAVARLRAAGLPCDTPAAGFFAWPQVGLDAAAFAEGAAAEAGVLVSCGDDFGPSGRGHVRLNYAVPPERLDTGLTALAGWLRDRPGRSAPAVIGAPREA